VRYLRWSLLFGLALTVSLIGIVAISMCGTALGADLSADKSASRILTPADITAGSKLSPIGVISEAKPAETENVYYLVGNFEDAKAVVNTDMGEQQTSFRGSIAFRAIPEKGGGFKLILEDLNMVSSGVPTKKGDSGVIGLTLANPEYETAYDQKTGNLNTEFQSTLHYSLIDKIKGYIPDKSKEGDVFYSYTETMAGKLAGSLPEALQLKEKTFVPLKAEIRLELDDPVIGLLEDMVIYISIEQLWEYLGLEPAEIFLVQPVFIGTGDADPSATGSAFDTLIDRSLEMWGRCGTVRCIAIRSNFPIYLDKDSYRVLDNYDSNPTEAIALLNEVDVPDAVEVFVVERWDPAWDGGGATWSSGTASTKIITCDQQLDVPCPPPAGLWGCAGGSCGDVNYYHLAHELGHSLALTHPGDPRAGRPEGTAGSIMEPSGFCRDNPNVQSAHNCRTASNPLLYWGRTVCTESPDIMD